VVLGSQQENTAVAVEKKKVGEETKLASIVDVPGSRRGGRRKKKKRHRRRIARARPAPCLSAPPLGTAYGQQVEAERKEKGKKEKKRKKGE